MVFAVHISDGVLLPAWQLAGAFVALCAACRGAAAASPRAEVPRLGVMTAAFFVASQIHLPVGGVGSAHLLLNGLMAVVLGRRAVVAMAVGLTLQALLFGHGGWNTLGVNLAVYVLPTLPVPWLVRRAAGSKTLRRPAGAVRPLVRRRPPCCFRRWRSPCQWAWLRFVTRPDEGPAEGWLTAAWGRRRGRRRVRLAWRGWSGGWSANPVVPGRPVARRRRGLPHGRPERLGADAGRPRRGSGRGRGCLSWPTCRSSSSRRWLWASCWPTCTRPGRSG